jgi:hypothetical protein
VGRATTTKEVSREARAISPDSSNGMQLTEENVIAGGGGVNVFSLLQGWFGRKILPRKYGLMLRKK